jgi:hypothetical protein
VASQATRVDAVILVAIVGMAAGFAVPRQADLARAARREQVEALARSAGSAAALAHAQWEARGRPPTLPGARGLVAMVNGYPSAATLPLLLATAETAPFAHESGAFRHAAADGRGCGVDYAPPGDSGAAPRITTLTDGC